ncbi:hypothetical protein BD779DRAFT_1450453 [Infundibulicybe gibba]|nr:hypothetical protein BD779DRAFT_1450453 [Infundibulicybe gibba]
MSLPTAQKDISAKPAPGSVVDPVNKAAKDADVDRKIRLYGVIEAFRQGRMPSNQQIDQTLQYVLDHSPVQLDKLSPDGKKLIQDTRDIIDTARLMVQDKNADELFQNFVWHTRDVDTEHFKKDPSEAIPVDAEKARTDADEAVRHLRTLLSLVLTNSEVRKLLSDFSLIGRDLLARGASKAAGAIAPDADALSRVDDTAPQDQFITRGGRTAGHNETPVPEARIPGTDVKVSQHPREEFGNGARIHDQANDREITGHQARTEAAGHVERAKDEADRARVQGTLAKEDAKDQARGHAQDVRQGGPEAAEAKKEEADVKKQGIMDRMRGLRDGFSDKVPQEHKDRVNGHYERGKEFLTEEYFPEERRDQFIYRGKKVIIECQKHDDYQGSLRWLLSYLEEYATHGKTAVNDNKDHGQKVTNDPSLRTAINELRTLLERFANGKSLSVVTDAVNKLIADARRDEGLRDWFRSVDSYVRKVLLEPGYVLEPDCNTQGSALRESGRQFYDDKYKNHFDDLFNSVGSWFRAMGEDPLNSRFGEDWARLTRDLLFDSEGSLKFKKELWGDIRKVILPALVDKIGYLPIPRIEYTDESLDLVVENLTLSGRNLFPNIISLEAHNFVKFSPYNAIKDESHHRFTLTFGQMQADMRDVAFYFRKKTGIPKLTDSGLADVILGGEGLTATVTLVSAGKDQTSVFKVEGVHVKVDTLKFSIRDSKHDFLYKTLKPLATGLVKKQIQKAIADAITTGLEYVDGQLVGVRDRMASAKANEGESRTQVLQSLFQRKKEEASIKSSERASQFKVVSNKRNSILSTTGHPAGWVNRTAEKDEAAITGHEWRSEAYVVS